MPEPDGAIPFETDAKLAEDLRVTITQLQQVANGLDHLLALVPALANSVRAEAQRLERDARILAPDAA